VRQYILTLGVRGIACRYDRALEKANAATQQASNAAAGAAVTVDDDDDDFRCGTSDASARVTARHMLFTLHHSALPARSAIAAQSNVPKILHRSALDESLQRARRAAGAKPRGEDDIANEVIARRQQEDAALNQLPVVSEGAELHAAIRRYHLRNSHP